MQQKKSLFYRELLTSAFWAQEKWSRKCQLVKTALEWLMDQKNTLLYRDAEGNSSLDFMAGILQQKGVRDTKTKPQINLQARGECNAQNLEEASLSELSKGPQTQTRRGTENCPAPSNTGAAH